MLALANKNGVSIGGTRLWSPLHPWWAFALQPISVSGGAVLRLRLNHTLKPLLRSLLRCRPILTMGALEALGPRLKRTQGDGKSLSLFYIPVSRIVRERRYNPPPRRALLVALLPQCLSVVVGGIPSQPH